MKQVEGILVLEGTQGNSIKEFKGFLFGAENSAQKIRHSLGIKDRGYGEVVFNTSITGYQEILSDPSYYGQIISMTCPHIGNTGVNLEDMESHRIWCAGFVVHDICLTPSNWRSTGSLHQFLVERDIPAISGIDVRALTRHLRDHGVVRGVILPLSERNQAESILSELPSFEGRDLIREVTTPKPYEWPSYQDHSFKFLVVAMDFGIKLNLLRCLEKVGCKVIVVPAHTSAEEILSYQPHGLFLSNGPGDPSAATYAVQTVKKLLGKLPVFGVCMGHQILALALGGKTYKLKFGHRGGNQPVLDKKTQRVEISSHNHGYAVDQSNLPVDVKIGHVNLNDHTIEGLDIPSQLAFSVQYHPEASPGPHDSMNLFERFTQTMRQHHVSKVS